MLNPTELISLQLTIAKAQNFPEEWFTSAIKLLIKAKWQTNTERIGVLAKLSCEFIDEERRQISGAREMVAMPQPQDF